MRELRASSLDGPYDAARMSYNLLVRRRCPASRTRNVKHEDTGSLCARPPDGFDVCIVGSGLPAHCSVRRSPSGACELSFSNQGPDLQVGSPMDGSNRWPSMSTRRHQLSAEPHDLENSGRQLNFDWTLRKAASVGFPATSLHARGKSWPINYADLDPYYDTAEKLLRVRGGPRTHFSPPRRNPLPCPARRISAS